MIWAFEFGCYEAKVTEAQQLQNLIFIRVFIVEQEGKSVTNAKHKRAYSELTEIGNSMASTAA